MKGLKRPSPPIIVYLHKLARHGVGVQYFVYTVLRKHVAIHKEVLCEWQHFVCGKMRGRHELKLQRGKV